MMKSQTFVENVMLRGLIKDLADELERQLQHRYKDAKGHYKLEGVLARELKLVKNARLRLNGEL